MFVFQLRRWRLGAQLLAGGPTRAAVGRLALASPGRESSFGGLNYVVSHGERVDLEKDSVVDILGSIDAALDSG